MTEGARDDNNSRDAIVDRSLNRLTRLMNDASSLRADGEIVMRLILHQGEVKYGRVLGDFVVR